MVNTNIHSYLKYRNVCSILEIGAGKGTVILGNIFPSVMAIEHNPKYLNLSKKVDYIHAPLVEYKDKYFRDATHWYDTSKLQCLPIFDAIIVDGPEGKHGRGGFFTNIELFKAILYIFDDTHRLWDFRLAGKVADYFGVKFETYTDGLRWFSVVEPFNNQKWLPTRRNNNALYYSR